MLSRNCITDFLFSVTFRKVAPRPARAFAPKAMRVSIQNINPAGKAGKGIGLFVARNGPAASEIEKLLP
jgi:hypothetical protein